MTIEIFHHQSPRKYDRAVFELMTPESANRLASDCVKGLGINIQHTILKRATKSIFFVLRRNIVSLIAL